MSEDQFWRFAEQQKARPPHLFNAPGDDWVDFVRAVWGNAPKWAFSPPAVRHAAQALLPRVLAQMGLGPRIGCVSEDALAIAGPGAPYSCLPLVADADWMLFRIALTEPDLILIEDVGHRWRCPSLARQGADLIELGAWLWGVSEGKAAFRIARLCGLKQPTP